jgi:uncharacterized protein YuzB (UPF0349 family)
MPNGNFAISYCLSNVDGKLRKKLRHSNYHIIEDVCLQRCGHCYNGPFLVVGERLVTGASHEEILNGLSSERETHS